MGRIHKLILIILILTLLFVFSITIGVIFKSSLDKDGSEYFNSYLNENEIKKYIVQCNYKNEKIFLELPSNWKFEVVENDTEKGIGQYYYGIKFYPDESNHEKYAGIYRLKSKFGVCGTGLKTEKDITNSGVETNVGYFDFDKNWGYVSFIIEDANLVALNNNLEGEDVKEALNILKTMNFSNGK